MKGLVDDIVVKYEKRDQNYDKQIDQIIEMISEADLSMAEVRELIAHFSGIDAALGIANEISIPKLLELGDVIEERAQRAGDSIDTRAILLCIKRCRKFGDEHFNSETIS